MSQNIIRFQNKYFKRTNGTTIVNSLSLFLTDICMSRLEVNTKKQF